MLDQFRRIERDRSARLGENMRRGSTKIAYVSWRAAQTTIPVAITMPDMTAAEGCRRAKVKLIVHTAVVRAVKTPTPTVDAAVVAKRCRQLRRLLPIDLDERGADWRKVRRGGAAITGEPNCNK